METVSSLILVCIVCILGHVVSVLWLSSLLRGSAEDIDQRIVDIDNGLGFLGAKLLDPDTWNDILARSAPEPPDIVSTLIQSFMQNRDSPRDDYMRNSNGTFYGEAEVIEAKSTTTEDGDIPPRDG